MKKLKIELTEKVKAIIEAIDSELKGDAEFSAFLIADKKNIWRITDLWIPEQEIGSAAVDIPLKNGRSQYEQKFMQYHNEKNGKAIVGTVHSHHSMGTFHSGTDKEDIDNNAYLNLNAQLPFIDMVWAHKGIETWVVLKLNNGMGKQVFTIKEDNIEVELIGENDTNSIIEEITNRHPEYSIDADILRSAFRRKIDVTEMMKNIKEKTYSHERGDNWGGYGWRDTSHRGYKPKELIFEDSFTPKMRIEWHKKKKQMLIRIWNDPQQFFGQELEMWVDEAKEYLTHIIKAETGNKYYQIWLDCSDKQTYNTMREELEDKFEEFKYQIEEVQEEMMGIGGYGEKAQQHSSNQDEYDYRDNYFT